RFYRNQLATMELCDLLLLHFNEDFMKRDKVHEIVTLSEHFVLNNGYLQLQDAGLFAREPGWLLQVFVLMADTPHAKGIHSDTIRYPRDPRHFIGRRYRQNTDYTAIFMELMRHRSRVVRELSRMMRYGILVRYIPAFGHIVDMTVDDLFHVYTVDEHSLRL